MVESGFMNIKEWMQHLQKAQEYMETVKVKNMKSYTYKCGIKWGEAISLSHILCVILYCDTNDLQNNFSSSFRKKNSFETIGDLKKRHQKYFYFAKGIVEAVKVYGIGGYEDGYGPYYCGLSCVLNIGDFAVYLKSPTSTSKDIEVAINFATRDGIIMQINNINNNTQEAPSQRMFDCSWIGRHRLPIGEE